MRFTEYKFNFGQEFHFASDIFVLLPVISFIYFDAAYSCESLLYFLLRHKSSMNRNYKNIPLFQSQSKTRALSDISPEKKTEKKTPRHQE